MRIEMVRSFIRFEPDINDGTMFLFNKETGDMLEGDRYSYKVIKAIMKGKNIAEIEALVSYEESRSINEVREDMRIILTTLEQKGLSEIL